MAFHVVVWIGFPVAGALAGTLLTFALDWIVGLSWAPFQGPLKLVDEVTGQWTLPVLVGVGLLLGLGLALITQKEVARVKVSGSEVVLVQGGGEQVVPRESVATAFEEHGRLVLQDDTGRRSGGVLLEDLSVDEVRLALTQHGYVWVDKDPFDGAFARWIPGAPALSADADAILAARQKALEKNNGTESEDFRHELARIDLVVRDVGDRQYWRPAAPTS